MIGDRKPFGKAARWCEMVESVIHHVNDTLTSQANEVMVGRKVRIKASSIVPHVHFLDQPSFLQSG